MELQSFMEEIATIDTLVERMSSEGSKSNSLQRISPERTEKQLLDGNRAGTILTNALNQARGSMQQTKQIQHDFQAEQVGMAKQGENTG